MEICNTPEYQEMERLIPENVKKIRTVLEEEHNIVVPAHCDEFIARCIRTKDGNWENAIKLIRAYQVAVESFKQWDMKLSPSAGREIQNSKIVLLLKRRDAQGRYIMMLRVGLWEPEKMNFEQAIALLWMLTQHVSTRFKDVQTVGWVAVFDFTGFSLKHALAVNHWKFITLFKWGHNGVAGRLKGLHCVRQPKIATLVYKAVTAFLKEKQRNRVIMHDSIDSLLKHVAPQYLPTFVGGELEFEDSIDTGTEESFFGKDQYFRDMLEFGFPRE